MKLGKFFVQVPESLATALMVELAYASFFMCQLVKNTLFVGDDATLWGMMSPSQSDWER
jgi:hypothetical protein